VVPDEVPDGHVTEVRPHRGHALVNDGQVPLLALPPQIVGWQVAGEEDHINVLQKIQRLSYRLFSTQLFKNVFGFVHQVNIFFERTDATRKTR
jgi:hypothetical protein